MNNDPQSLTSNVDWLIHEFVNCRSQKSNLESMLTGIIQIAEHLKEELLKRDPKFKFDRKYTKLWKRIEAAASLYARYNGLNYDDFKSEGR